jgi:S1-C subfamily serine protease
MTNFATSPRFRMGRPFGLTARYVFGALLAMGWLLGSTEARGQAFDKAVLDRVKDATVYIKIKMNGRTVSAGSGFVIKATDGTVLVMTNRHVAAHDDDDDDEKPGAVKPEISVVFRSGRPGEQELPAKLLTFDHRKVLDLAMLEVKGVTKSPEPILADRTVAESELFETMTAYSLGFPLGGMISGGNLNTNPEVTVNAMTISSFRRGEAGRLERIQFQGAMIEGNSGGPIVNDKGLLVGVVVERLRGENVGRAIPPNVIKGFLGGDIDITFGSLLAVSGNTARFAIGGRMVDPLGKIRSMSARYLLQSALPNLPKPDIQGHYPIMPGSKVVPLQLRPSTSIRDFPVADAAGYGEIDLQINTPADRKLYFQIVVTDTFGRSYGGKPTATTIPDKSESFLHDLDSHTKERPEGSLAQWSCEVNLADGIKMKHEPGSTTISVPGGLAYNNMPQHHLFNAPCALVKVEGDFVTGVGIDNTFDPGSEGVILPNGKKFPTSFQSTGILIWQDEKNFVRFERSKGSDGKISMLNRILVEVYKNGKEAVIYYLDVPEQPIALLAVRKGGSLRLLFGLITPNEKVEYQIFKEWAVDFNNEVFVGLAAANLSKRPFKAKLEGFQLQTLEQVPIAAKPVKMTKLVDLGIERLEDGTCVFEGAKLTVAKPQDAPVVQQDMASIKEGVWSGDKQLLWNIDKGKKALTLELPVEATGKYEIKAKFTKGPDYGIVKLDLGADKPLYKGASLDLYAPEVKPSELMSLGTYPLSKGKVKLNITNFNKNLKSSGFHFGLDEIRLVPAK